MTHEPSWLHEQLAADHRWTPRQEQVLDLLTKGRTNAEIGAALGLTLDGAKWHVREIMSTLNAASREDAAAYWRAHKRRVPRARLAGIFGAGLPFAKGVAAVGGVVAAGGFAAGVLAMRGGDTGDEVAWELLSQDALPPSASVTALAATPTPVNGFILVPRTPPGTTAAPGGTPSLSPAPTPPTLAYFAPELAGSGTLAGPAFDPAGAADRVIVEAPAAAPFALTLVCNVGSVRLLDLTGPVGAQNASLNFAYPSGATTCHWDVTATGTWRIIAK